MYQPSKVTQESGPVFDLAGQLGLFAFNTAFQSIKSNGRSSFKSDYLFFDSSVGKTKRKVAASLSFGSRGTSSVKRIWVEFNRVIRFHCQRIPIGFASVGVGSGYSNGDNSNGLRDNGCDVLVERGLPLSGVEAESPKKVLILMSDTGGGHRASAEAIKAAFNEEFGDDYQVGFGF